MIHLFKTGSLLLLFKVDFYLFRGKKIHSSAALQLLQTQKYLLETIYTASVKAGQSWAIPYCDKISTDLYRGTSTGP